MVSNNLCLNQDISAILDSSGSALPGDTTASPVRQNMTAQTNPVITRTAHLIKRASKPLCAKFPARRMVFMVRSPKPRKMCKCCGLVTDELCLGICYDCVEVLS